MKKTNNVNTLQSLWTKTIKHDKAALLLKIGEVLFFLGLNTCYTLEKTRGILKILEMLSFKFK